jgi:hypothetical protein
MLYIWIDSLCIIQDKVEDWQIEAAKMGSIYRHSFCNIAATGFQDGRNVLFVRRDPLFPHTERISIMQIFVGKMGPYSCAAGYTVASIFVSGRTRFLMLH